ncbi:MAG: S-layer homology domain-containing protein, partial [Candidatus Margulisiibacteriota bacterium]
MDTKKAIIIFILAVFLVSPSFAQFMDIPKGHEAQAAVQKLLRNKIIELPPSRKFNGSSAVDMYQMAFILDRLLGYAGKLKEIEAQPLEEFYVDVPPGHYAHKAVRDLVKFGLFVVPDSKKFNGAAKLDRYTFYSYFAAFIERIEGKSLPAAPPGSGYADVKVGHPAYIYIQKLVGAGLLDGKGDLEGNKPMSRYEMAIFVAGFLDFYAREEVEEKAEWMGYTDLPKGHFAHQAIDELVEVGILPPGEGRKFYGDDYINRYFLVDFISKIIEKIVVGEEGELPLASPARSYKDVSFSNFAYRSTQKLIELGVIPAGNRVELFYGDRKISRYQMVYFVLTAIEDVLSDVIGFQTASPSLGYGDVPPDHFVYETIQKLIWLGVLEGGEERRFSGEEFVTRYELCYFTV